MIRTLTRPTTLPVFLPTPRTRHTALSIGTTLCSSMIEQIVHCVLGPRGTNIGQAAQKWSHRMGVAEKSKLYFCPTPEASVEAAHEMTCVGSLAIFWTCAVFVRENQIFFDNPHCLPLFFSEEMPLDDMQLAARPGLAYLARSGQIPTTWRILSHPSPAPLVKSLRCRVIEARSNSEAATRCADGEAEACITTETARELYGLRTIHDFGSPLMVFFGGITAQGLDLLDDAYHKENS